MNYKNKTIKQSIVLLSLEAPIFTIHRLFLVEYSSGDGFFLFFKKKDQLVSFIVVISYDQIRICEINFICGLCRSACLSGKGCQ